MRKTDEKQRNLLKNDTAAIEGVFLSWVELSSFSQRAESRGHAEPRALLSSGRDSLLQVAIHESHTSPPFLKYWRSSQILTVGWLPVSVSM